MLLHKTRPVEHKACKGHIDSTSNDSVPTRVRAPKTGARRLGALAVGALAIGAVAFGALAIGRLVIGRARIRRLDIDELVVGRFQINDALETPSTPRTESDTAP